MYRRIGHGSCSLRDVTQAGTERRHAAGLAALLGVASVAAWSAFAQPELKVIRSAEPVHPGEPYRVVYEVSWEGEPGAYAIGPAKVETIDWGVVTFGALESTVRAGINVVAQEVTIIPGRTGRFEFPEILIPYRNPEDLTPPEAYAPATNPTDPGVDPTLVAPPFILLAKPDRTLAWVFGGLGALLLCLMLGGWSARKRRRPAPHPSFSPPPVSEDLLQDARRSRLDGNAYAFYLALIRALELCPEEGRLAQSLKTRAQEVGFGGTPPSDDRMNADYDAVRRALDAQLRKSENPRA